jgi:branched-chain amino acid transport system permease protein
MQRQQFYNLLTVLLLFAIIGAILLYAEFVASAYVQRIIILLGINMILVVSLNLSNGFTGVFSLGHIGFMAIGAYTAALLTLPISMKKVNLPDLPAWLSGVETSLLLATLIGGLLAMAIAFLVGLSLMRLSGPYVSVATLGFLVIVQVVLGIWDAVHRRAATMRRWGSWLSSRLSWSTGMQLPAGRARFPACLVTRTGGGSGAGSW